MRQIGINTFRYLIITLFCAGVIIAQDFSLPITTSSDEARNAFKEGRAYFENVHTVKAAEFFDQAIKLDPEFALAHLFRGLTNVGGFNVAETHINKAVSLADKVTGGEKNLILYQQAVFNGDQVRQKMYLDNLIVAFPYNKRIQALAGTYYYGISDYKTALDHLRKSVAIDENFAPSYNMIGYAESGLQNYEEAEKAFKKYIELQPDLPNPYDSYAELLLHMGRYDESIKEYQLAYDKDNTFLTALLGIGHNYIFKGDYKKARENYDMAFSKASSINQKLAALFWNGTSYIYEGKLDDAMKVLDKRKSLAQKNGLITTVIGAINLEGFILTEMGQPEKGMKKFEAANKMINASNLPKEIKSNLELNGQINMCYSLASNNKIAEAEKEAQTCTEMVNKRGNENEMQALNGTIAILDMKKGDYQSAIDHFKKTDLENSPYNMQKLAISYQKMGNTQMANDYFDKVKKSNQNGIGYALIRNTTKD
jgi:tetratricopeptide (TPR) repeat protein